MTTNHISAFSLARLMRYTLLLSALMIISCKTTQTNNSGEDGMEEPESSVFSDKITIIANAGIKPDYLQKKYEKYVLNYKGLMSKKQNKMMFTFDDTTISNKEICDLITKDNKVIIAEPLQSGVIQTGISKSSDKQVAKPVK